MGGDGVSEKLRVAKEYLFRCEAFFEMQKGYLLSEGWTESEAKRAMEPFACYLEYLRDEVADAEDKFRED
jgi:hypothetical protein